MVRAHFLGEFDGFPETQWTGLDLPLQEQEMKDAETGDEIHGDDWRKIWRRWTKDLETMDERRGDEGRKTKIDAQKSYDGRGRYCSINITPSHRS